MTRVEKEILELVRQKGPVSEFRLGLSCRRARIFARLVQAGRIVSAGTGLLGTNWRVK